MEHCFFGNNVKSKIKILNLIRKIYLNKKNPNQKYFLKFVCVFINAVIGWNFNILNGLCQIIFLFSTLSETDQTQNHVYTNSSTNLLQNAVKMMNGENTPQPALYKPIFTFFPLC